MPSQPEKDIFYPDGGSIDRASHEKDTLTVRFRTNQRSYTFSPVTEQQFVEFKKAKSQGKYLHANITTAPGTKTTEIFPKN